MDFLLAIGEGKRLASAKAHGAALRAAIPRLHPVEVAASLLFGTCTLEITKRRYGGDSVERPEKVDKASRRRILLEVLAVADNLLAAQPTVPKTSLKQARCQLMGARLAVITVGAALEPGQLKSEALKTWKAIWPSKAKVPLALQWLRKWESETGITCLPESSDGGHMSDIEATELSGALPHFLKGKPAAKKAP